MAASRKFAGFFFILLLLALAGVLFLMFRDLTAPELTISPQREMISTVTEFMVEAKDPSSGVKSLRISVVQRDTERLVLEKTYPKPANAVLEKFTLKDLPPQSPPLDDGDLTLIVEARDGSYANFGQGMLGRMIVPYVLDTVPPKLSIRESSSSIRQGGAAAVAYTLDAPAEKTGVVAKDLFFPGYRQEDGSYICFFTFPYYMDKETFHPLLTARDEAGNVASQDMALGLIPQKFKDDKIHLPDSFLDSKMPEFEKDFPGQMSNLERFLKVNRELRKYNRGALHNLALDTSPTALWKGSFLRMPRSATRSTFGDRRSYIYQNSVVDQQTHLGVDLASVKHDDVPASNDGRVVFAGVMGIYGKVVIIDHGFGLQSLYGHLSEMHVNKGDAVKRGQIIGKTGVTGLAGGDHLHFGIIVGGIPVNPMEWWDKHWLEITFGDVVKNVGLK